MRALLATWLVLVLSGCISQDDFDLPEPPPTIEEAPYPTLTFDAAGWSERLRVGFDPTLLTGEKPLEHFPLLVRLIDESSSLSESELMFPDLTVVDFDLMQDHGEDLRFTSPTGDLLAHEIEAFDGDRKTARVWVRVPRLGAEQGNDYIWLHYSNFQAPELPEEAGSVWTSDYLGVWHMGLVEGRAVDSSQWGRDAQINLQPPETIDGLGGGIAARFEGRHGAEMTVELPRAMDSMTVHALAAAAYDDDGAYTRWIAHRRNAFSLTTNQGGDGERRAGFQVDTIGGESAHMRTGEVAANKFYHVAGRYDRTTGEASVYQQGTLIDSQTLHATSVFPTSSSLNIGEVLVGAIDELFLSAVPRSGTWLAAEAAAYRGELTQSGVSLGGVKRNSGTGQIQLGATMREGEDHALVLLGVAVEGSAAVRSVEGLGLAWTQLHTQCAGDNRSQLEVWVGQGIGSGGLVTVELDDLTARAQVALAYLRGVTGEPALGTPTGRNAAPTQGCIAILAEDRNPGMTVERETRHGFVVRFVSTQGAELTETTPGFELALLHEPSELPVGVTLSTGRWYPASAVQLSGTFAEPQGWAQVAVEVFE